MFDKIDMAHQLWIGFWMGVGTTIIVIGSVLAIGLLLNY